MTKIKLTIEMDVTEAQAITLKEMFEYWTRLGNIGSSRTVAFFVDGDGNFQPNCKITTSERIHELPEHVLSKAITDVDGDRFYDFDPIAWALRNV